MPLRREEEIAARTLEEWLKKHYGFKVAWEPVSPDPPDLCFTVDSEGIVERWAVEVTGLFQYTVARGQEKNIRNVEAPLSRLAEKLNKALPERTTVGYVVMAFGPQNIDLSVIEKRALDYINSGKTEPEPLDLDEAISEVERTMKDPTDPRIKSIVEEVASKNTRVSIRAVTRPMKVSWGGGLDGSSKVPGSPDTMIADVATLRHSTTRILDAKLPRIKSLAGYERRMLLIWSGYFFADSEHLKEILHERKLTRSDVDTILLIDSIGQVDWVADPGGVFEFVPSENQIAQLAYSLWERRGRPFGSPEVDWFKAEQRLR